MGEQVGLARRLSPWQGRAQLTFATDLLTDLPCTLAALTTGAISEWRAGIIARETTWLSAADRLAVDAEVAGDRVALARLGNRQLTRAVTAAAYRRDPQGALARARAAENDRNVSIRPKPDAMCRISALLPVAQGVATYAALSQAADAARAEGDPRSRGQVLADTVVERVTGQTSAAAVPVEVQVVLSDAALLGSGAGAEHPAQVPGYGTVPAGWGPRPDPRRRPDQQRRSAGEGVAAPPVRHSRRAHPTWRWRADGGCSTPGCAGSCSPATAPAEPRGATPRSATSTT